MLERIKRLITGKYVWVAMDGSGDETIEHYAWKSRWAIDGPQPFRWWWVRKYGSLECGCTRNPITRRMVTYLTSCKEHCGDMFDWLETGE